MMRSNTLLVGACPPTSAGPDNHSPLYPYPRGCAGDRLCRMIGLGKSRYLLHFDRINLVADPNFSKKWDKKVAAMCAANLLRGGLMRDRYTILLGKQVLAAFSAVLGSTQGAIDWMKVPQLKWLAFNSSFSGKDGLLMVAPHPSGRNRSWNDENTKELFRIRVEETLGREKWRIRS